MSGLEQRTNDRDGAPDGCRGVMLRVAGASRSATGLAQIAEIAQIPKTSIKWASARSRDVPALIAQIAEIILRSSGPAINMWWTEAGPIENTITENTEVRLEAARSHKVLRLRKSRKPPFAHVEAIRASKN